MIGDDHANDIYRQALKRWGCDAQLRMLAEAVLRLNGSKPSEVRRVVKAIVDGPPREPRNARRRARP